MHMTGAYLSGSYDTMMYIYIYIYILYMYVCMYMQGTYLARVFVLFMHQHIQRHKYTCTYLCRKSSIICILGEEEDTHTYTHTYIQYTCHIDTHVWTHTHTHTYNIHVYLCRKSSVVCILGEEEVIHSAAECMCLGYYACIHKYVCVHVFHSCL